ncbi:geranyl-CoA carboxylase alpha subunit [Rhizobiales bacterium GAS191]|nr:geranyl-CoA carboxylase alpha subunit [Rhizobiales bacterium GAS191]
MARPFQKILIANRGEIACRVMRTARAAGYRTVAVFSEADAEALHVQEADEAVLIGPAPTAQSYLAIERIIAAARRACADAVHPGYGFLSENADFASACGEAGLVFIGPSVEAIRAMGDKAQAKRRMIDAGVPCVPGYQGDDQTDGRLATEAERIGYPVMVKASAGGGGRGMRLVDKAAGLAQALKSARSEAKGAFGDSRLIIERAIIAPRHVEIQVFGDAHGNVIHLGERDCSIQRRHQKVVEEAPSPAVAPELRARMGAAAVTAARSIDYVGAGTIEFLVDAQHEFYFLEMNTRLQVEHPVTELVTGLDLVSLQLDVAQGRPLPIRQEDVALHGHAIEVRLYAEDPRNHFLPQTGEIAAWQPAQGEGVRVDHGLREGVSVSPFYDPMLAKIIGSGRDREEARRRLTRALEDTMILGVRTNKEFLLEALAKPDFIAGKATTAFIEANFEDLAGAAGAPPAEIVALAAALFAEGAGGGWQSSQWRETPLRLFAGGETIGVGVVRRGDAFAVSVGGATRSLRLIERKADSLRFEDSGHVRTARYALCGPTLFIDIAGQVFEFEDTTLSPPEGKDAASDGVLRAPMNGLVVALDVKTGDRIRRGQVVAVIEAMKMEHAIVALVDGSVESVAVVRGAQVASRDVLVTITTDAPG